MLPEQVYYWLILRGKQMAIELYPADPKRRAWIEIAPALPSRIPGGPAQRIYTAPTYAERDNLVFFVSYYEADTQEVNHVLEIKHTSNIGTWPDINLFAVEHRVVQDVQELEVWLMKRMRDISLLRPRSELDLPL